MKQTKRCRLPGYDSRTSRSELLAFTSLGVVGAALVVAAVSDAWKFAQAREGIISSLTRPGPATVETAHRIPSDSLTNLSRAHTSPPASPCTFPTGARAVQTQPM